MSDSLSVQELEGLRQALQVQARKLREALALDRQQLEGANGLLAPAFDDGRDEASLDVLRDLDVAELSRRSEALMAVEAALDRLAEGTYGVCQDCGSPISRERLNAAPESLRCLGCQSQDERRHASPPRL